MATTINNGLKKTIISSATTTQITPVGAANNGPFLLGRLIVSNVGTGATINIYDDDDATDDLVYTWETADGKTSLELNIPMYTGIRVVTAGTFGRCVIVWGGN